MAPGVNHTAPSLCPVLSTSKLVKAAQYEKVDKKMWESVWSMHTAPRAIRLVLGIMHAVNRR
jgi:hypothetical protein